MPEVALVVVEAVNVVLAAADVSGDEGDVAVWVNAVPIDGVVAAGVDAVSVPLDDVAVAVSVEADVDGAASVVDVGEAVNAVEVAGVVAVDVAPASAVGELVAVSVNELAVGADVSVDAVAVVAAVTAPVVLVVASVAAVVVAVRADEGSVGPEPVSVVVPTAVGPVAGVDGVAVEVGAVGAETGTGSANASPLEIARANTPVTATAKKRRARTACLS